MKKHTDLYADFKECMQCNCHSCIDRLELKDDYGFPLSATRMILCSQCGNKRCPHASDHRLKCTNSNDAGQEGSVY